MLCAVSGVRLLTPDRRRPRGAPRLGAAVAGWHLRAHAPDAAAATLDVVLRAIRVTAARDYGPEQVAARASPEIHLAASDVTRHGVASELLGWAARTAVALGAPELTTHASITARPFFEAQGFVVVAEQHPVLRGVEPRNDRMRRPLAPA